MVLVLCYDVVADGRRARLFKGLKGYLRPVQKSVFEGRLPERRWDPMIRMVSRIIEPAEDSVRIYWRIAEVAPQMSVKRPHQGSKLAREDTEDLGERAHVRRGLPPPGVQRHVEPPAGAGNRREARSVDAHVPQAGVEHKRCAVTTDFQVVQSAMALHEVDEVGLVLDLGDGGGHRGASPPQAALSRASNG
jgi:CRISPR-associated endonuclease Cas2